MKKKKVDNKQRELIEVIFLGDIWWAHAALLHWQLVIIDIFSAATKLRNNNK